jgi:hypothetical protein
MKWMSGGLPASLAMLIALAACSSQRSNVRLGSLTPSPRSLDYDPGIVSWKLPNQLTVAMMPDRRVNLVSVEVRYQVGAAEDPPGKTGLAHLVEHVMFARRVGPGGPEVADRLSAAALRFNAWTTWDSTHYIAIGLRRGSMSCSRSRRREWPTAATGSMMRRWRASARSCCRSWRSTTPVT